MTEKHVVPSPVPQSPLSPSPLRRLREDPECPFPHLAACSLREGRPTFSPACLATIGDGSGRSDSQIAS